MDAIDEESVRRKYQRLRELFNERERRLWAAVESAELGRGGISTVARATGLSRTTIYQGLDELGQRRSGGDLRRDRVRNPGGGRKPVTEKDPKLVSCLEQLVEPTTRGEPESPLRWTCKSTRQLSEALKKQGHPIGRQKVCELLNMLGYSLQANRKTREGSDHEDRDAQFRYINAQVNAYQQRAQPVISVDAKKKELVGDFKNAGREWSPRGKPVEVRTHDFIDRELGKVNPYGVYDQTSNTGWVSVGTDHDTAAFAVETIRRWWLHMGQERYPQARDLLITADGGGSNGYRLRLWKVALQTFANETALTVHVCHFPPGTSKWNKIEHRMFSFISLNWRGKPLICHEVIVNLIGSTHTDKGLAIHAELDTDAYPKGIKITDAALSKVNLKRDDFHGEWNYTIAPNCST
ncbi:ISAzo13 family transposase [Thiococcus pfennigii]|uniref:ISAzo13 family transposase n=1 Tax=Thiococcus pfennigii TaxID=1057 RepID=UPI0019046A5B|nr:ISAzo13 family transposase [Thiococcus pfennigii]MBK1700485.1 ISAzo13 family transposase [Thiococcus pfennigii]